jgi:hypothetical protein
MADTNLRILLDTASVLNSRLAIQNQQDLKSKTLLKKDSVEGKKVILEDIKDGIETYNREFMEREKDIESGSIKEKITTIQDYSLVILFSGFALFVVIGLVYILQFSKAPIVLSISYMVLIALVYVFLVFIIQRYG